MPGHVVKTLMIPSRGHELIEVMDDYGTVIQAYVPIRGAATRPKVIADHILLANDAEAVLEDYAKVAGQDLTELKKVGLIKKTAYAAKNGITLPKA